MIDPNGENLQTFPMDIDKHTYRRIWSPDGTKYIFTISDEAGRSETYVVNVDGGDYKRLTISSYARWSPDGTQITFISTKKTGIIDPVEGELYQQTIEVINSDGSERR